MAVLARRKTDGPPLRDPTGEELGPGIKLSLILHLAAMIFIMVKSLVFPGEVVPYIPALRVDVVGLPDLLKKDLKNAPKIPSSEMDDALKKAEADAKKVKPIDVAKEKEPVEEASPDEMVLNPKRRAEKSKKKDDRKNKLKSALDRIKALSKISEDEDMPKSKTPGVIIKGNRVSKGTSLSGDAREAEAGYLDQLRDKLQENWALPVWLERQKLSAQVQIYIDAFGRMRGFTFVRSSGNAQFDDQVKRTLQQSQPFPQPPEDIASSLMSSGVLVGFPL